MGDIISAVGGTIKEELGIPYAGQEPQEHSPTMGDMLIINRIGGTATQYGRKDRPWVQFTAIGHTKKGAYDLLKRVRQWALAPRTHLGPLFVYSVSEALPLENATAQRDTFYRYRVTFEYHVKGLA